MRIKKEIFSRGVRMSHQFEELIPRVDPLGAGTTTFDVEWPMRIDRLSGTGRPYTARDYGQHNDRPDPSPVCHPSGGCAHMDNPSTPDEAMDLARPVPVGTKRRLGHLKTDK